MAEGERPSDSWESWIGGWVQTAKEKSSTALEMVKKDLAEFTCTIQKDTERAVEITKESLNKENTTHATNRVKAGLTSFLDNISRVLVIPPDDDYVPVKVAADGSGLYDRGKARLHAIQLDASTYMDPPDGPPEQYSMWLESFNMDEHKGEISELLVSKVEVRALYTKLVPSEVSHAEFWQRYIYRVHQLQCDEARKQALMKRADETKGDSFSWDDDDDWSEGDEEDNHSDWEKMPRPSQLLAAETQQSKKQHEESHVTAVAEKNVENVNSDAVECTIETVEPELKKQIKEDVIEEIAKFDVSVPAEILEQSQDEPKPDTSTPTDFSSISDASQDIDDDSKDLLNHPELQMKSADLWSLHIPNDTASASHLDHDIDYVEAEVLDLGSPLDDYAQANECAQANEPNNTFMGSENCAAVGDASSGIFIADAASGTADIDVVSTLSDPVLQPSPDVSAASLNVSDKPDSVQISDKDMSPLGTSTEDEFPRMSEQSSQILPVCGSKAADQQESVPTSVNTVVEVVPDVDVLKSDHAEDMSGSVTVTLSPQTLSNPANESSALPDSPKIAPQNDPLTSDDSTTVMLPVASDEEKVKEMGMRLKGDMIVVGDRDSPLSSESTDTKGVKNKLGLEEDWEQDFDIEVTEDDLKTAESIAKKLGENLNVGDDDWENWE